MKSIFFIFLIALVISPAYGYNSGVRPVYQPNGGGSVNLGSIHEIGNVTETGCALAQYLSVNATGFFVCTTLAGSGEVNTASNVGLGEDVFKQKTVFDLEFKGFAVSGDLTISSNSTDITISHVAGGSGNSTLLDDLGDVVLTAPANFSILFYNGFQWLDQIFKSNSITCTAGQFFSAFDNQTGDYTCSTPSGGAGFNNIASVSTATNATIISDNSTVANRAVFKTISAGSGIQIDNGTSSIIIKSIASGGGFTTIASEVSPAGNATILAYNNSGTRASFKTISAGTDMVVVNGSQTVILSALISKLTNLLDVAGCSVDGSPLEYQLSNNTWICGTDAGGSGGATSITSSNITSTSTSLYTDLVTIPLTASSGNYITAGFMADSDTAGNAVQFRGNVTGAGYGSASGSCLWETPITATTTALDMISVRSNTDTGETAWLHTNGTSITAECNVFTDASATNLVFSFQNEAAGTTIVQSGYYIKVP